MKRRGGVLTESLVALLLLSLGIAVAGRMLSMMKRQSRLVMQHAVALQECHLALASVAELPPSELSAARLAKVNLPNTAQELLSDGELKIFVEPAAIPEEGTRIRATVKWRPTPLADPATVELSCWRFDVPHHARGDSP
jgi:hypothetical protein